MSAPSVLPPPSRPSTVGPTGVARRHFVASFGPTRAERLLRVAIQSAREQLEALDRAGDDGPRIGAALHAIKGIALYSGLAELSARIEAVEAKARATGAFEFEAAEVARVRAMVEAFVRESWC